MSRITILEKDNTSPNVNAASTQIAFVPGFSVATPTSVDSFKGEGPAPVMYPWYCDTVAEFEDKFGQVTPTFAAAQYYPSGTSGFSTAAIPGAAQADDPDTIVMYPEGAPDLGYIYAKELISAGIPVVYMRINASAASPTVASLYSGLSAIYASADTYSLGDPGEYSISIFTSGGYPVLEYAENAIAINMASMAAKRGEAIALLDHTDNPNRALTGATSAYGVLSDGASAFNNTSENVGVFTPWGTYALSNSYHDSSEDRISSTVLLPASFGYCRALGYSLSNGNPSWLSIAGVGRGKVPGFVAPHIASRLTNSIAETTYQPNTGYSINAITQVKPYGYCIWGNRTLKDNSLAGGTTATSFMNLRMLVNELKKVIYTSAKSLLFEQNTDILWVNFRALIIPTLELMKSTGGIENYRITKDVVSDKSKVAATITLYPLYAVESFDITVVLTDEEVSVE